MKGTMKKYSWLVVSAMVACLVILVLSVGCSKNDTESKTISPADDPVNLTISLRVFKDVIQDK